MGGVSYKFWGGSAQKRPRAPTFLIMDNAGACGAGRLLKKDGAAGVVAFERGQELSAFFNGFGRIAERSSRRMGEAFTWPAL